MRARALTRINAAARLTGVIWRQRAGTTCPRNSPTSRWRCIDQIVDAVLVIETDSIGNQCPSG